MDLIDQEGFRANVGIVICAADDTLLLGGRKGQPGWQFPQGGIQVDETPEQAMYRELWEEVGLRPDDVELLATTREWLRYRLPERYVRRHVRPLCIGQKQRWYLLRLLGDDSRLRLDRSEQPEFDRWRWVDYWRPVREVIYFKRPVYAQALTELAPALFPGGPPPRPDWWQDEWQASGAP
ncbi:MAG: RNA pyrophosphohydrolase [Gammaproteobacteria bacterium]|nr:MAG: RNA pyrophosphohydrolase [Gammaproteobacteria bacterium]